MLLCLRCGSIIEEFVAVSEIVGISHLSWRNIFRLWNIGTGNSLRKESLNCLCNLLDGASRPLVSSGNIISYWYSPQRLSYWISWSPIDVSQLPHYHHDQILEESQAFGSSNILSQSSGSKNGSTQRSHDKLDDFQRIRVHLNELSFLHSSLHTLNKAHYCRGVLAELSSERC